MMDDNKKEEQNGADTGNNAPTEDESKKIDTFIEIGKFYYVNKKYKEAMEQFENGLSIEPENEEILSCIGLIHEVNNEIDKAKNIYQKILKKNPEHKSAKEKLNKLSGL